MSNTSLRYIGDVSQADAKIISEYAKNSNKILEFGCGASTQILAQSCKKDTLIISVDTEIKWINSTRKLLTELDIHHPVKFVEYAKLTSIQEDNFDIIFNDGLNHKRKDFGIHTWNKLKVGGTYLTHDTRRQNDVNRNVNGIIENYFMEIGEVKINVNNSNITSITKTAKKVYENWNGVEKRQGWMINPHMPKPKNWKEILDKLPV